MPNYTKRVDRALKMMQLNSARRSMQGLFEAIVDTLQDQNDALQGIGDQLDADGGVADSDYGDYAAITASDYDHDGKTDTGIAVTFKVN